MDNIVRSVIFLVVVSSVSWGVGLKPITGKGPHYPVHAIRVDGGRVLVVEQRGRILEFEKGRFLPKPLLDIRQRVSSGGERGLLSVAPHPEYEKKNSPHYRRYFVNYTAPSPLRTVIAEYRGSSTAEKVLLEIPQPYSNHNGGHILFGPDGYLYIGMGDGGAGGDPQNYAQNLESLLGKILRIDVNGKAPYAIPKDNPLVGKAGRDEIYSWGLRNPWRMAFDSNRFFAADVGQNAWEEIHLIEKGKNYGWRPMEGKACYIKKECRSKPFEMPIHVYSHSEGQSITGGVVYRGKKIPKLRGDYLFADYESGKLWALKKTAGKWASRLLLSTNVPIASFAETKDRELILVLHRSQSQPNLMALVP